MARPTLSVLLSQISLHCSYVPGYGTSSQRKAERASCHYLLSRCAPRVAPHSWVGQGRTLPQAPVAPRHTPAALHRNTPSEASGMQGCALGMPVRQESPQTALAGLPSKKWQSILRVAALTTFGVPLCESKETPVLPPCSRQRGGVLGGAALASSCRPALASSCLLGLQTVLTAVQLRTVHVCPVTQSQTFSRWLSPPLAGPRD